MSGFFGRDADCPICKMMRSLAFSGIGAGIGVGIGRLLNLEKQDVWMCALGGAFVMVFLVMKWLEKK
ncbi:MAG: hypothetical protein JKX87_05865 [Cycloclasticus sp.]|nr:hypothetical protein [Cycloclasticus sp.]